MTTHNYVAGPAPRLNNGDALPDGSRLVLLSAPNAEAQRIVLAACFGTHDCEYVTWRREQDGRLRFPQWGNGTACMVTLYKWRCEDVGCDPRGPATVPGLRPTA